MGNLCTQGSFNTCISALQTYKSLAASVFFEFVRKVRNAFNTNPRTRMFICEREQNIHVNMIFKMKVNMQFFKQLHLMATISSEIYSLYIHRVRPFNKYSTDFLIPLHIQFISMEL